jgi:hypothetical protein
LGIGASEFGAMFPGPACKSPKTISTLSPALGPGTGENPYPATCNDGPTLDTHDSFTLYFVSPKTSSFQTVFECFEKGTVPSEVTPKPGTVANPDQLFKKDV